MANPQEAAAITARLEVDGGRRHRQAHLLWHQAAEFYHEPERFLTNINSLIQELRNITFILQSEKARLRDFDVWYLPLQVRLKVDKNCKWLHDTRNVVVKQGALRGTSIATIRLLTTSEIEIARVPIPEGLSSEAILHSAELEQRLPQVRAMVTPDEDPVLVIEKSWSTAELEGREILEVLAEVYASLADIVLSAHVHLGELSCIPLYEQSSYDAHRDFPLLYDRSGRLRCMMHEAAERADFFRLATLEQLVRSAEYTVSEAVAFGDFVTEQSRVQAADVGMGLDRESPIHTMGLQLQSIKLKRRFSSSSGAGALRFTFKGMKRG